jgi:hypothetical protein
MIPACGTVIFSNDFAVYRRANIRNVYFWSKENLHFLENWYTTHCMSCCCDACHALVWSKFFEGCINLNAYLNMLWKWFAHPVKYLGLISQV